MTERTNGKVVAIIVTYNPDLAVLERLIDRCAPQVSSLVLVDNGDGGRLRDWLAQRADSAVTLLPLGENKGIASAQNAGIAWARQQSADYVLVFDHDSAPPSDLVVRLLAVLTALEQAGEKVAAVGPRFVDPRWKDDTHAPSPFIRLQGGRMVKCFPEKGQAYVAADFLIASGSLMPLKALDAVGGMEDRLFIDYVDIEWGLRARRAGWGIYGVWDAVMEHSIGDQLGSVLGREFTIHSSLRHYYMIRNALWLCLHADLLLGEKGIIALNAVKKFIAYSLFMPQPLTHLRYMCRGVSDGVRGRMGKIS